MISIHAAGVLRGRSLALPRSTRKPRALILSHPRVRPLSPSVPDYRAITTFQAEPPSPPRNPPNSLFEEKRRTLRTRGFAEIMDYAPHVGSRPTRELKPQVNAVRAFLKRYDLDTIDFYPARPWLDPQAPPRIIVKRFPVVLYSRVRRWLLDK